MTKNIIDNLSYNNIYIIITNMDDTYLSLAVAFSVFIVILLLPDNRRKRPSSPSLPGPSWRDYLPNQIAHALISDPQQFQETLHNLARVHGQVYFVRVLFCPSIVTSHPDDIIHVLSLPRTQVDRDAGVIHALKQMYHDSLMVTPDRKHTMMRKTIRENFSPVHLHGYHNGMVDAMKELCALMNDAADRDVVVDVGKMFATATVRIISNVAFNNNFSLSDRIEIDSSVNVMLKEMMVEFLGYPFRKWVQPFGIFHRRLESAREKVQLACKRMHTDRMGSLSSSSKSQKHIETEGQKEQRPPDLLDAVLKICGNEDSDGVTGHLLLFLIAGAHTSSQALLSAVYELCQQPTVVKKLQQELDSFNLNDDEYFTYEQMKELKYTRGIWRETLRCHAIAGTIGRKAKQDITLRGTGTFVPSGTTLYLLSRETSVNSRYWKNSEEFRPERWIEGEGEKLRTGCFLPYGAGNRNCVGAFMADHEGVLILAEMFRRFEFSLACRPEEVVSVTQITQTKRFSSKGDGVLDMSVPVRVSRRFQA